jgi:hypothetical protein
MHSRRFRCAGAISEVSLLIEGLNQFAVRLGRQCSRHDVASTGRLLPVAIKSLEIAGQVQADEIALRGEVIAFGTTLRIQVSGRYASTGADVVRATIVVAEVGRSETKTMSHTARATDASGFSSADSDAAPLLLAAPLSRADDAFAFVVNPRCALLNEHFPSFPIAPGSLVIGYVAARFCERLGSAFAWNRLSDVQFLAPLVPGPTFRGSVQPDPSPSKATRTGRTFTLLAGDKQVVMRGTFGLEPAHTSEHRRGVPSSK